jgi:hypothetical protein
MEHNWIASGHSDVAALIESLETLARHRAEVLRQRGYGEWFPALDDVALILVEDEACAAFISRDTTGHVVTSRRSCGTGHLRRTRPPLRRR